MIERTFGALQSRIAIINVSLNLSKAGTLRRETMSSPITMESVKASANSAASRESSPPSHK